MQAPFADKVVFITGATSGIGQGVAVAFGAAGGRVVGVGRRAEAGAETLRLVASAGGDFTFIAADISREDAVEAAIRQTVERHGRLDCAVNSAAVDIGGNFVDFTFDDYERIFAANVRGLFLSMRAEIRAMRVTGGAIVNIGSISGQRAIRGNALYNASKSAATALMRSAAAECGGFGIRINEVAPGPVATPMLLGWLETSQGTQNPLGLADIGTLTPLGGISAPSDIAHAVLFLCSPQASRITGALLTVDGGFVLG